MEVKIGMVVKAIAGRDKDRFFVIKEVKDNFVLIVDGKSRKLEFPKKKKIKHLRLTKSIIDIEEITNKKLKKNFK